MDEIKFFVQGSSPVPYETTFRKVNGNLSARCNCPAGKNGMYCKHRLRILNGSTEGIVSDNLNDVKIIKSWFTGSDIEKVINELDNAEKELKNAKKKVSLLKKRLSKSFLLNFN